jgi:hypothetical protein
MSYNDVNGSINGSYRGAPESPGVESPGTTNKFSSETPKNTKGSKIEANSSSFSFKDIDFNPMNWEIETRTRAVSYLILVIGGGGLLLHHPYCIIAAVIAGVGTALYAKIDINRIKSLWQQEQKIETKTAAAILSLWAFKVLHTDVIIFSGGMLIGVLISPFFEPWARTSSNDKETNTNTPMKSQV